MEVEYVTKPILARSLRSRLAFSHDLTFGSSSNGPSRGYQSRPWSFSSELHGCKYCRPSHQELLPAPYVMQSSSVFVTSTRQGHHSVMFSLCFLDSRERGSENGLYVDTFD
jgi:hypothetical protein